MSFNEKLRSLPIGERIRLRRSDLGLTVEGLARIMGKNKATIYRYENGDISNLPTSAVGELASALKVTPAYLMGWDEDDDIDLMIEGLIAKSKAGEIKWVAPRKTAMKTRDAIRDNLVHDATLKKIDDSNDAFAILSDRAASREIRYAIFKNKIFVMAYAEQNKHIYLLWGTYEAGDKPSDSRFYLTDNVVKSFEDKPRNLEELRIAAFEPNILEDAKLLSEILSDLGIDK